MDKKKIVYIVSNIGNGGAEKLIEALALNIDKNKFEVFIAVLGKNLGSSIDSNFKKNNIKVYYCYKSDKDFIKINIKLYKIIKMINPDIVHVHTSILFITAFPILINRVEKRLYTIHSQPEYDSPGLKRKINSILFKYFKFEPIAISNAIKTSSEKYFSIKNINEIINGIDISKFSSDIKINHRNKYSIINVGRFIKIKNQNIIIEAVAELIPEYPNLILNLVGNGVELENNINLSKKLKVAKSVIFHGEKNNIGELLEQNSIFILPSSYEGVPISIIEAMANGNVIIASNVGGIANLIKDNYNGLLINPTKEDIKNSIRKIINDEELRIKLSENALMEAKKFDIYNCVRKHEKLYLK